jgi:hypothetical protein
MKTKVIGLTLAALIVLTAFWYYENYLCRDCNLQPHFLEVSPDQLKRYEIEKSNERIETFESLNIKPESIKTFGKTPINYTSSTGVAISFKNPLYEARNPGSHVYLNQKEIGTVEGQGVIEGRFSNDNRQFLFSVISACGAGCLHKYNYSIDVSSSILKREI